MILKFFKFFFDKFLIQFMNMMLKKRFDMGVLVFANERLRSVHRAREVARDRHRYLPTELAQVRHMEVIHERSVNFSTQVADYFPL